jgi:hypothetical protein
MTPFKSDKQRKAVMAKLNQGYVRSDVKPVLQPTGKNKMARKKLGTLKASDMGGKGWKDEKGTYPVYKEGNVVYLTGMGNSPYTKGQKWKIPISVRSKIKKTRI